jgi:hypothetical protein
MGGVWGLAQETTLKSVSSAWQKILGYPKLGEADPGGLGACPQENDPFSEIFFFFQKKKQKALFRFAEGSEDKYS